MKTVIFAYSKKGCVTARKISENFSHGVLRRFTVARLKQSDFDSIPKPSDNFYGEQFYWADALIFVGSCGIAVREIAPHIRDKRTDPAVIVIDELGLFAIPLLSGHIGGANALAKELGAILSSIPVITTATDINGRFSVDTWASKNGFVIGNIKTAKLVSASILEKDVSIYSDFPITKSYPNGLVYGECGEIGIYVGYNKKFPFEQTLQIIPPVLHIGIGCRKGVSCEIIHEAVNCVLEKYQIDKRGVKFVASINLKEDEQGLKAFALQNKLELQFYSPEELLAVSGEFTASEFVRSIAGVDNVCERAAMIGAECLLVKKTIINDVTVAVAAEKLEVSFG